MNIVFLCHDFSLGIENVCLSQIKRRSAMISDISPRQPIIYKFNISLANSEDLAKCDNFSRD